MAGVGGEPQPWICSRHRCKPEGTRASGGAGFPICLLPVGVSVTAGVGTDVMASTVILDVSDFLGVKFPLGSCDPTV